MSDRYGPGKENRASSGNGPRPHLGELKAKRSGGSRDDRYAEERRFRFDDRSRDDRPSYDDRHSHRHDYSHRDDHRSYHDNDYDRRRRDHDVDDRRRQRSRSRERHQYPKHGPTTHRRYEIVPNQHDSNVHPSAIDPRNYERRMTKQTNGRNTESFDPASTLVRPDLRVHVGSSTSELPKLKHDDVVIVPEFFGRQDDWSLYYKLVEEMTDLQSKQQKGSEWISWHEGAHLISKNPQGSPTFEMIIDRLCKYFSIRKTSVGTRFNWYKDSADWKPFHHDSAAFNPQRAKNQNITVGVSFGAMRELAFIRAAPLEDGDKLRIYFPQTNNGVFSFGRDANILWKVRQVCLMAIHSL